MKSLEFSILYFPFTRPSAYKLLIYRTKKCFHEELTLYRYLGREKLKAIKVVHVFFFCVCVCVCLWYRYFHSRFNAIFFLSTEYKKLLPHFRNSSSNVSSVKKTLTSDTSPLTALNHFDVTMEKILITPRR